MKLSSQTISILKNYSQINVCLQFRKGSTLSTVTDLQHIAAVSKVTEEFPVDFAIYNLHEFLAVLSIMDDPTLEFGGEALTVRSGNQTVEYRYADPSSVESSVAKKVKMPEPEIAFRLPAEAIQSMNKASAILRLDDLVVQGNGEKVTLVARDPLHPNSNKFVLDVEAETEHNFSIVFLVANLRLLPGTYDVKVSSKGIAQFNNTSLDLTYWIASEAAKSTFGSK